MQCGAVEKSISNLRRRMPPGRFVAPCLGPSPLCRLGAAQLLLHLVPGGGHGVGHLVRGGERTHGCGPRGGHTTGLQLAAHMCSPSQQRYARAPWPPASGAWPDQAARPDAARAPRREMRTSWMAYLRGLGLWAGGRVVRERSKSFVAGRTRWRAIENFRVAREGKNHGTPGDLPRATPGSPCCPPPVRNASGLE